MKLFCYGSLEFALVMRAVTGRGFASERARLEGHARYRVRDAEYPGLVPEPGAQTEGTLFRGLDAEALAALDRFEGALYERLALVVRDAADRPTPAQVYVVRAAQRGTLSRSPWDKRDFERNHLRSFLDRIRVH